jgi:hypothetical protein
VWISSTNLALWPLVLAVCACNGALGLDSAVPDFDHDGVADTLDNCPFDLNPQQRDSDRNGLGDVCDCAATGADVDADGVDDACDDCIGEATGRDVGGDGIDDGCEACAEATGLDTDADGVDDACDPCALGPDHDEDNDGVADACDNCPTLANPDQGAAQGAILGYACAQSDLRTTRFDSFVEQDYALWPGIVPGWSWVDDGVVISGAASRVANTLASHDFVLETRGTTAGQSLLDCRSALTSASCGLDAARTLTLTYSASKLPPITVTTSAVPGVGPIRIRFRQDASGVSCEAIGDAGDVLVVAQAAEGATCPTFRVSSNGTSRLDYLWIVTK